MRGQKYGDIGWEMFKNGKIVVILGSSLVVVAAETGNAGWESGMGGPKVAILGREAFIRGSSRETAGNIYGDGKTVDI